MAKYYDFISVGSTRIADRPCEVLRVVARDGSRYSYIVWMDEDTKLPLRVDLLDRDGETLEQYRVISSRSAPRCRARCRLLKANLPPLLSLPAVENVQLSWSTGWLPAGVDEVARNRRKLPNVAVPVESRLYSDGLFSFGQRQPGGQRSRAAIPVRGAAPFRPKYARATKSLSWANCRRLRPSASPTAFLSRYRRNDERVGHGGFVATGRSAAAL